MEMEDRQKAGPLYPKSFTFKKQKGTVKAKHYLVMQRINQSHNTFIFHQALKEITQILGGFQLTFNPIISVF